MVIEELTNWHESGHGKSKVIVMRSCFFILIIILLIGWLLGFFAFDLGWFIHFLLVAAIILLLLRLIGGR